MGEFFVALSVTLTASVLLSLLYALTFVPLLAEYLLAKSQLPAFFGAIYRTSEPALRARHPLGTRPQS